MANSIYGAFSNHLVDNGIHSRERMSHDNLISFTVADDMNTYRTWGSFGLAVDVDPLTKDDFDKDGKLKDNKDRKQVESEGVRSIFNKLHAVPLENETYGWRISQNMPLLDSPKARQMQRSMNACTVRDLVRKSQQGMMGTAVYDWSDFMYCKYLGKMSNNYMITLRRYTIPVADYIKPYGNPEAKSKDKITTQTDTGGIPLGCMVTWMGTPGNELSNILKYSFNMPFKSTDSKFEDDGSRAQQAKSKDSSKNALIGGAFQKAFGKPAAQRLGNIIMPGIYNRHAGESYTSISPHYDSQKAYAGVDMIKSIWIRDVSAGLKFSQKFDLTFDYELKSYDGINGKQAMLDLLGNILTVCYTTGDFWPGAYRSNAQGSSLQPMSSLECMQHHNTFSEYVTAFSHDFTKLRGRVSNFMKDPIGAIVNLLDNLGGVLLGGEPETAPPAQQSAVEGLLSDTAVGQWHVTIGNPCAPIMSMGNLILTNCEVQHYGALGLDDFPTGLRVKCSFEHGKPRDKRLIERMYIGGNDRIYMPLDQTVFDILKKAQALNQKYAQGTGGKSGRQSVAQKSDTSMAVETKKQMAERDKAAREAYEKAMSEAKYEYDSSMTSNIRIDVLENLNDNDIITRLFGHMAGEQKDQAIRFAAGEVNCGAPISKDKDQETGKKTSVSQSTSK